MTQSFMKIPRSARIQATHLALFPSKQTEIDRVFKEMAPKEISKKDFYDMVNYAITPTDDSPFPFLYVDVFAKPNERFRRNFNERLLIDLSQDHSLDQLESGLAIDDERKDNGVRAKRRAGDLAGDQQQESKRKKRQRG